MQFVSPKPNGNNIGKAGDCETNFCYKRLKEVNVTTNSDNEHEEHGENGTDADDEDVLIDRQTLNKGYKSKWQQR